MAALDRDGRITDRTVLTALGWPPGTATMITITGQFVTIVAGPGEITAVVNRHGHLRLPATVRHRIGLRTGDRALLATHPHLGRLDIYPPAALDLLLTTTPSADGGASA